MYRYFLDGTEFFDAVGGIESVQRKISRVWNGTGSDNILRKSLSGTLTFTGAAFNYICSKFQSGYCERIDIEIRSTDGSVFYEGSFFGYMATINVTKRTVECEIKDNSWSSVFRNRTNQEVWIRSERTIGCEPIARCGFALVEFYDVITGTPLAGYRLGFDVLDVLDYLAKYLTDNQVGVVSNYLQTVQYGIYTSKVLNTNTITPPGFVSFLTDEEVYPIVSFDSLFEELRKKEALYIAVEETMSGVVLRIEPESYFFNNTTVFSVSDLPYDTILTVDTERLNSIVKVGQGDTELGDTPVISYQQRKYFAWQEDVFNSCNCESDKDNELDLVSDFIIDTNQINEALFQNREFDRLFLIHTSFQLPFSNAVLTQDGATGNYYYNDRLRNPNVIERWGTYLESCIYDVRQSGVQFELQCNPLTSGIACAGAPVAGNTPMDITGWLGFTPIDDEVVDTDNGYPTTLPMVNPIIPFGTFAYQIPVQAYYIFEAQFFWELIVPSTVDSAVCNFSIVVYSDDTATTEIYRKTETVTILNTTGFVNQQLYILSDFVLLPSGACVIPEINTIVTNSTTVSVGQTFQRDFFRFSDAINCFNLPNEAETYPYVYEFQTTLCNADFEEIDSNQAGKVVINGIDTWISEVSQDIKGQGTFRLLSNTNICCNE